MNYAFFKVTCSNQVQLTDTKYRLTCDKITGKNKTV